MSRGYYNWNFYEVTRFLKDYHFSFAHTEGSHYFYVGHYGGSFRQVCIPFHGARAISPRTLKGIIRQSGISEEKWLGHKVN